MRIDQLRRSSPLDVWLINVFDKFRIPMPKDENSLYKAIAQQIYPCQNYFENVKCKCLHFYSENYSTGENTLGFEHLSEVDKLTVLSSVYRCSVVLFKKLDHPPEVIKGHEEIGVEISLRLTEDGFYESILPVKFLELGALCQSLVYEILYVHVFGFTPAQIDETVANVRLKKYNHNSTTRYQESPNTSSSSDERMVSCSSPIKDDWESELNYPPFPFRVAKSLDPDFYRNDQFDLWLDYKKECLQLIQSGDKVIVKLDDDREYKGHVQEVSSNCGPVCVFVEELGKKITLPYDQLSKIPQAMKPLAGTRGKSLHVAKKGMLQRSGGSPNSWQDEKTEANHQTDAEKKNGGQIYCSPPKINLNLLPRAPLNTPVYSCDQIPQPLPYQTTVSACQPGWANGFIQTPQLSSSQPMTLQNMPIQFQNDFLMVAPILPHYQPNYVAVTAADIPTIQYEGYLPTNSMSYSPNPQLHQTQITSSQTPSIHQYPQAYYQGHTVQPQDSSIGLDNYGQTQSAVEEMQVTTELIRHIPSQPVINSKSHQWYFVPYHDTIKDTLVNYQAQPSKDPEGNDLPTEKDTLRFFYNLGCEYFATTMCSGIQSSSMITEKSSVKHE